MWATKSGHALLCFLAFLIENTARDKEKQIKKGGKAGRERGGREEKKKKGPEV